MACLLLRERLYVWKYAAQAIWLQAMCFQIHMPRERVVDNRGIISDLNEVNDVSGSESDCDTVLARLRDEFVKYSTSRCRCATPLCKTIYSRTGQSKRFNAMRSDGLWITHEQNVLKLLSSISSIFVTKYLCSTKYPFQWWNTMNFTLKR